MNTRSFRSLRRGTVSAEYVLAASLAASLAMVGVAFPAAFGDLLFDASDNMDGPSSTGTGGGAAGGGGSGSGSGGGGGSDDFANPGTSGSGGGLGQDPWSGSGDGSTDGSGGGGSDGSGGGGTDGSGDGGSGGTDGGSGDGGTGGSGGSGDGLTDGSGGDGSGGDGTDGSGGGTSSSGGGGGWGSDPWSDPDDDYESSDPWTLCNQGLGNGAENCDPGNSNNVQDSNDEPGSAGRGNDTVTYTLEDGSTYTVTRGRGGSRNR